MKYKSNGWYNKTGFTTNWYQFVMPIEIGEDKEISDETLEAWKQNSSVPENALIITNARPEFLIISMQRRRLEEFVEGYEEEALEKEELEIRWQLSIATKRLEPKGMYYGLSIERVSSRFIPDTCEDIDSTTRYCPRVIGDENIAKYQTEIDKALKAGKYIRGYMIPRAYATGIFKAQKKNGEATKIALYKHVLYGKQDRNKNVYVMPELQPAIENFYGLKGKYPWTCKVCKSMIQGTQWGL